MDHTGYTGPNALIFSFFCRLHQAVRIQGYTSAYERCVPPAGRLLQSVHAADHRVPRRIIAVSQSDASARFWSASIGFKFGNGVKASRCATSHSRGLARRHAMADELEALSCMSFSGHIRGDGDGGLRTTKRRTTSAPLPSMHLRKQDYTEWR